MSSVNSDDSGDELSRGKEGPGIDFIEQWLRFNDVGFLSGRQRKSRSFSGSIDSAVEFRG